MYEHVFQFFGLRENPFHVSPDPRFYFSTKAHRSALTRLTIGIDTRQGFLVLTGEAGTGKTILLHRLLTWLQARGQSSCYIFQSQLSSMELFEAILNDFGVPYESRRGTDLLSALNQWLARRHARGDSPVVIIDEAQAISLQTLDRLRMLLNLEAPGSKLLQVVLAGQPELEEKLRRPELRQLHQRVMFRCSLASLSFEETAAYVKSRLTRSGIRDTSIFPDESLAAVHIYAQGVPRLINLLCEHALLAAYTENEAVITPEIISRVATVFDLGSHAVIASAPTELPRYGGLAPEPIQERPKHHSLKTAALAEYIKQTTFTPRIIEETEMKLEPRPASILPKQVPITLSAVAGAIAVGSGSPKTMANVPQPCMPFEAIPEAPKQEPKVPVVQPKPWSIPPPMASKPAAMKGNDVGLGSRFVNYGKGVRDSFVRDWKQFLRTYVRAKRASRPDS
jgi:general secretion pathway protein A